jgi:hypothetical protein
MARAGTADDMNWESYTMPTTLIRKADLIVAWDASEKSHTYLPDADMAFTDGVLRFVGRHYEGPADEVMDGKGLMIMPVWSTSIPILPVNR